MILPDVLTALPAPANQTPMLTNEHRYFVGKEHLPGVSEILQGAGLSDFSKVPADRLEYARVRGTAVHLACHYYDMGVLNWDSVDPAIVEYVRSYIAFKQACPDYRVMGSEISLTSKVWRFCGTVDKVASFGLDVATVDVKTPAISRAATKIQTAGYHLLVNENYPELKTRKRFELKLFKDGKRGELIPFNDLESDIQMFLWCLSVHHWKLNNLKGE